MFGGWNPPVKITKSSIEKQNLGQERILEERK
jgi:hypothetical protein